MSMRERAHFHQGAHQTAIERGLDRSEPTQTLTRIEAALHELGETVAMANTTEQEDVHAAEELEASLRQLDEAIDQHQQAIEKALQGLSPWGEIKHAGTQLQAAVQRLRAR